MKAKLRLLVVVILTLVVLAGCIKVKTKSIGSTDGGVFVSVDRGDNWSQITAIYRVGEPARNFNTEDLTAMIMDPLDSQALYVTTHDSGLFYSYNGGAAWQQTLENSGRINAVAISPLEPCVLYTAIANRVYKSVDCSRHWTYKLIEARADPDNQILSLAIDPLNSNNIYAGTSGKGLFKSSDGGYSWQVVKFFDDRIVKILILPANGNIIYLATASDGLFKTTDQGASWQEVFSEEMKKEFSGLLAYREVILDPTVTDGLLYAADYGIFRSADGGASWQNIKLLTPPKSLAIYSLAINPQNGQEIYYGTATVLYRTEDGGANWITRKLPSSRVAKFLMVDPKQPDKIYLGVKRIK